MKRMKMKFEDKQFPISRAFTHYFEDPLEARNTYIKFWYKRSSYLSAAKQLGIYDSMVLPTRNKRYGDSHAITYNQWQAIRDKQLEIATDGLKSSKFVARYNAEKSLNNRELFINIMDKFFNDMKELEKENEEALKHIRILQKNPMPNETRYILKRIVKNEKNANIMWQLSLIYKKYFANEFRSQTGSVKILQKGIFKGYITTNNKMILLSMEQIKAYAFLLEHYVKIVRHKNIKREARDAILHNLKRFINDPASFDKYDVVYQKGKTYRSLWL